jgi:hypothetical protein
MPQLVKPKQGHLREQCAFAGDGFVHDHIKRADAIRSDHQNAVVPHGIVVTNFASGEQRKRPEGV